MHNMHASYHAKQSLERNACKATSGKKVATFKARMLDNLTWAHSEVELQREGDPRNGAQDGISLQRCQSCMRTALCTAA